MRTGSSITTPFSPDIAQANHWRTESLLRFCRYYYQRAWKKQPGAMLRKIGVQLGLFYNLNCPAYCDNVFRMEKNATIAMPLDFCMRRKNRPSSRNLLWLSLIVPGVAEVKDRSMPIKVSRMLRRMINWLGNAYLPLHLVWLVALPWICWRVEYRRRFWAFLRSSSPWVMLSTSATIWASRSSTRCRSAATLLHPVRDYAAHGNADRRLRDGILVPPVRRLRWNQRCGHAGPKTPHECCRRKRFSCPLNPDLSRRPPLARRVPALGALVAGKPWRPVAGRARALRLQYAAQLG